MRYFISLIACLYFYRSKRIMAYSTMVKRLAPQREILSTSPGGAVYFFRCVNCLCGQYIIKNYVRNHHLYKSPPL